MFCFKPSQASSPPALPKGEPLTCANFYINIYSKNTAKIKPIKSDDVLIKTVTDAGYEVKGIQ